MPPPGLSLKNLTLITLEEGWPHLVDIEEEEGTEEEYDYAGAVLFTLGLLLIYVAGIAILIVTTYQRSSQVEDEFNDHLTDIQEEIAANRRRLAKLDRQSRRHSSLAAASMDLLSRGMASIRLKTRKKKHRVVTLRAQERQDLFEDTNSDCFEENNVDSDTDSIDARHSYRNLPNMSKDVFKMIPCKDDEEAASTSTNNDVANKEFPNNDPKHSQVKARDSISLTRDRLSQRKKEELVATFSKPESKFVSILRRSFKKAQENPVMDMDGDGYESNHADYTPRGGESPTRYQSPMSPFKGKLEEQLSGAHSSSKESLGSCDSQRSHRKITHNDSIHVYRQKHNAPKAKKQLVKQYSFDMVELPEHSKGKRVHMPLERVAERQRSMSLADAMSFRK